MKILYLTNHKPLSNVINDYMSDLLLHGLREIYGAEVTDYPGPWYLYKDESKKRNLNINDLWGKGFTTKNSLENFNSIDRSDIENKIKKKYFDLIIYSSIRRSHLFLDEVIKYNNKLIFIDGEDDQLIDQKFSKLGIYLKRELQIQENNLHPIHFAIPENKIANQINLKPVNILAPLIPGRRKTYIYNDEQSYYKMYQNSLFALSYKKGGWDCLRHYEILMNGCLPLFINLDQCPKYTLTNLPKEKLAAIFDQYQKVLSFKFPTQVFKKKNLTLKLFINYFVHLFTENKDIDKFVKRNDQIFALKNELLNFTRSNLTTKDLAKYVLNIASKS